MYGMFISKWPWELCERKASKQDWTEDTELVNETHDSFSQSHGELWAKMTHQSYPRIYQIFLPSATEYVLPQEGIIKGEASFYGWGITEGNESRTILTATQQLGFAPFLEGQMWMCIFVYILTILNACSTTDLYPQPLGIFSMDFNLGGLN